MARLGVFILWLIHFLPFRILVWMGNALGWLLYSLATERRRVATVNLRLCFPDMGDAARAQLVLRNFMAFARSFLERCILWWGSGEQIKRLIRVEGIEHFHASQGKPTIFLMPHFVGLDVGASWFCLHTNGVTVYSSQKNSYLNEQILKKRLRFGQQRLYSRQQGMRPVVKALREGLPFFYLPDQDLTVKDGAFIPFFGVPAATLTALPRLAEMADARIVPCVVCVLPGAGGYVLRFYPAWENYPTADVIADTRRVNEFIEQRVLEMPEQYFWLHKRFKTRPEGEEKLY